MAIILPNQRLIRPNPLAYPAGATPGFDPSHPAAKNMSPGHGLSAVAFSAFQDGQMLNLLTSRVGVNVAHPFANPGFMNGYIGPSIVGHGSFANSITFPGNAAVVDPGQTLAAIFYYQSGHVDNPVLIGSGSAANAAWYFYVDGATKTLRSYTTAAANSGIVLTGNQPYFVAVSNNGSDFHWVAKNLSTGALVTADWFSIAGNNTAFTSSGTYTVQSDTFNNQCVFPIAAVSYTPAFLSPSQLLAWSADPWSFWYPRNMQPFSTFTTPVDTNQYAAFYTPQHDGGVYTTMTGY